jgi:putative Ca2+/H+ antiporter (TMEM165/GDT1 family)
VNSLEWLTWITTYTLIILAELGDKTQLATLILVSNNPTKKWVVFSAGALALSLCVFIEVTIGASLAKLLSPQSINQITGVVFLVIGLFTLYSEYKKTTLTKKGGIWGF